eukprot:scaffold11684_cov122-Isochrysis_galbana.AAC.5
MQVKNHSPRAWQRRLQVSSAPDRRDLTRPRPCRVEQGRVDELGAAVGKFLKWRWWRGYEQAAHRARAFWGRYNWAAGGFHPHSASRASSKLLCGSAAAVRYVVYGRARSLSRVTSPGAKTPARCMPCAVHPFCAPSRTMRRTIVLT